MKPIEAFENIKKQVDEHRIFLNYARPREWKVDSDMGLWFRGEAKKYKDTTSTLAREVRSAYSNLTDSKPYNDIKMYQMWVYTKTRKFLYENNPELYDAFNDSWDYPFFMQHYGVPTNFIDFTPSLETALYFATLKADKLSDTCMENDYPRLWLFDPHTHNFFSRENNSGLIFKDNEIIFKEQDPEAYHIGSAYSGDFYDFMVFGGEWRDINKYSKVVHNASEINGKPNFVEGIPIALSPHSQKRQASIHNQRMYSQTGYFYYSSYPFKDLTDTIYRSIRFKQPLEYKEFLEKRLLKKIVIPIEEAKLIKQYLIEKGYTDEMYGFGSTPNIVGFNKGDFSYQTYLTETNNGWDGKDVDFVKKYIAPLEIWLKK